MSAKIITFDGITRLDIPVDRVLDAAKDQLEGVVIIGFKADGEFYAASTYADGGTVIWLLESCKKMLLEATS